MLVEDLDKLCSGKTYVSFTIKSEGAIGKNIKTKEKPLITQLHFQDKELAELGCTVLTVIR